MGVALTEVDDAVSGDHSESHKMCSQNKASKSPFNTHNMI